MNREERNIQSRQRILNAAMKEFSCNGYEAASINTICTGNDISKGILYHYYKDKDELFLVCVEKCYSDFTEYLSEAAGTLTGSAEYRIEKFFDFRIRFFADNPDYLGIFISTSFSPSEKLLDDIRRIRRRFENLNTHVLTDILKNQNLRDDVSIDEVVQDFSMYMDYFNLYFKSRIDGQKSADAILNEHEQLCHRQLKTLLYGVISEKDAKKN